MKIKLIQPKMLPRPMDTKLKTRMSPSLALLTIANLMPKEHEVIIENENVEKIDFDEPVDLVAITVTVDVMNRAVEISKEFQNRNVTVIAGGIILQQIQRVLLIVLTQYVWEWLREFGQKFLRIKKIIHLRRYIMIWKILLEKK